MELYKDNMVPTSHPIYNKISAITQQILISNQNLEAIKEKNWTLNIVDLPLQNAFVLPVRTSMWSHCIIEVQLTAQSLHMTKDSMWFQGGNIFVFTGILKIVENVDQLSVILAHEIAHVVLGHSVGHQSPFFRIAFNIQYLILRSNNFQADS